MPITVEAFAQYLTVSVSGMRGTDYDALVFVHALKGRAFSNYADIKAPDGKWKRIDPEHPEVATEIFVTWATLRILHHRKYLGGICLVPVPNKSALISAIDEPFPTLVLTQKLAARWRQGVTPYPALRWKKTLEKAQSGGPRQAWQLYQELAFVPSSGGLPRRVVLVDDVCTGGGHLQACAAKLRENGYSVDFAVCGAKTMHQQQPDPFSLPAFTLDDYIPGSNPFGFTSELP